MSGYSPFQGPFFDSAGDPLASGKLHTYVAGSTTDQATYQDAALTTPHANPIILDAEGKPPADIWFLASTTYKLALVDSADVSQTGWPKDNLIGIESVTSTQSEWIATALTPTFISTTQFSVPGDHTVDFYEVNRRIKVTETAGIVYGRVSAASFGSSITTVTVVLDSGTIGSGITATSVGLISVTNQSIDVAAVVNGASLAGSDFTGHINTARATVASHATTSAIWAAAGNQIDFTGTETLTDLPAADQAGSSRILHCAAACTFTDNANLDVQGGTFTAAAGDRVIVDSITTTTFKLTIQRASGITSGTLIGVTIMTSGNITLNASTKLTIATLWGGGGGGGAGGGVGSGGFGGKAGANIVSSVVRTGGETLTAAYGAGGAGGVAANGTSGASTTLTGHTTASGGHGGAKCSVNLNSTGSAGDTGYSIGGAINAGVAAANSAGGGGGGANASGGAGGSGIIVIYEYN